MTLLEIKRLAMQELGFSGYDYEEEVEAYEPALTAYINQAYSEVFTRYDEEGEFVPLAGEEDEPDFAPGAYHTMLAYYAAGRIMSSERGEKQTRAAALLEEYFRLLMAIRPRGKRAARLINKY